MVTNLRLVTDLDRKELEFHRQYVAELIRNRQAEHSDSSNK